MSHHYLVKMLLMALSAYGAHADDIAAGCPSGDCKYQSSVLLQKGTLGQSSQLVDALEDEDRGTQAKQQHRSLLLIERDLSQLSHLHYNNYDSTKGVDDNMDRAFNHFLDSTGLRNELDDEEQQTYLDHFKDDLAGRLKHDRFNDNHDLKTWFADLAKSLEEQKPMVTRLLVENINRANLSYKVALQKWIQQLSKHDWDDRMGKIVDPDGPKGAGDGAASLLQRQGRSIPDSFESAQEFPACSSVISRAHNQGRCGSCWAFGSLSALDSRLCIKSNASFSGPKAMLSRGHITSCALGGQNGCGGGLSRFTYDMFQSSGGVTGGDYGCSPYFGHGEGTDHFAQSDPAPPCPSMCASSYTLRGMDADRFKFSSMSYQEVHRGRHADYLTLAKQSMMTGGPLPFGIYANNAFMSYSSGVFAGDCTANANHEVVAVGWGQGYISGLNSWGSNWGNNGGFKVSECGVTDFTIFDFSIGNDVPNPLIAVPGPTPVPTPSPPHLHPWEVTSPCTQDSAGCVMSGNYPSHYSVSEKCEFTIHTAVPMEVVDFSTESGFDFLSVDGQRYSGADGGLFHGRTVTQLSWESDSSVEQSGWKLCPRVSSGTTQAPMTTRSPATPHPTHPMPMTTQAPMTTQPPPMTTQSPTNTARRPDDSNWIFTTFAGKQQDCSWVQKKPDSRCSRVGDNGVLATVACAAACGVPSDYYYYNSAGSR